MFLVFTIFWISKCEWYGEIDTSFSNSKYLIRQQLFICTRTISMESMHLIMCWCVLFFDGIFEFFPTLVTALYYHCCQSTRMPVVRLPCSNKCIFVVFFTWICPHVVHRCWKRSKLWKHVAAKNTTKSSIPIWEWM